MMIIHSAVAMDINSETIDIYSWGINRNNGDRQIEVWTFDVSKVNIFKHDNGLTIETSSFVADHQFNLDYGQRTLFDSAVVMDGHARAEIARAVKMNHIDKLFDDFLQL